MQSCINFLFFFIVDEMVLGKTLQSISVLVYMKEYCSKDDSSTGPNLVVVPTSTVLPNCTTFLLRLAFEANRSML